MTVHPDRRALTPSIGIVLSAAMRELVPELTLAVARRSPAACRLTTTIDLSGRPEAFQGLLRRAVERVTALPARSAVIRAGHEIRDELLVAMILALGEEYPAAQTIQDVVETVGVLATDFYRGTRIVLHAFILLPDLGARDGDRYARAYAQLTAIDRGLGEAAPRLNGRPVLDRRWIADCRTDAGAHAGGIEDTILPLAEFLSTLTVGSALRELDGEFEGVLHGAHHGRGTGYSAPGYAELVFSSRSLKRYFACRFAAEAFFATARAEVPSAAAPELESAVERCFGEMELDAVAAALLPPPPPGCAPADREVLAHRRRRERERSRARARACATACVREIVDRMGGQAGKLFARLLIEELTDETVGTLRPSATVARLEAQVLAELRGLLGIDALLAGADRLETEADRSPVPDAEGADSATISDTPSSEEIARANARRREAGELRERVRHLEALLAVHSDPDRLEAELGEGAPTPAPGPEVAAPVDPPATRSGLRRGWLRGWFRPRSSPDASIPATDPGPASPAIAGRAENVLAAVGSNNPVEWLRWLRELREELRALAREVAAWEDDLVAVSEFYAGEADFLRDDLTRHRPFSHRLLSGGRCDELYAQREPALRRLLEASGAFPLGRYLASEHPPPEPLKHPINLRFAGVDRALDLAAEEALDDWSSRDVEDVLLHEEAVRRLASPEDRLRALADSGAPLVRPRSAEVRPGRSEVVLLSRGREESEVPAVWPGVEVVDWIDAGDPSRCAVRTSLHGFALHALAQLWPLRAGHLRSGDPAPDEPLPWPVLVDEPIDELLALALAFGVVHREEEGRLVIPGLRVFTDRAELARRFRNHFDGREAMLRIGEALGRELRRSGAAHRLRAGMDTLDERERAILGRTLEGLQAGRWPAAVPWTERGAGEDD